MASPSPKRGCVCYVIDLPACRGRNQARDNVQQSVPRRERSAFLFWGHDELIHKDWFQTLPDFNAYVVRKGQALSDYACDPTGWRRKCLVNIAKAGMFSSDRTIAEYDRDIWHLGK